jgi:hypothetical protein
MPRFIIVVLLLLAASLVGPAPAPATQTRAPALTVLHGTLRWNSRPGVHRYVVASAVGRRVTHRVVDGTRFTPASTPGQTVGYMVRARVRHARWSRVVRISWPALSHAGLARTPLKVSVNNTTGWGVDAIFYSADVRYERLDVGDGSDLGLVAKALSDGMTPLVLYNPDAGGSLLGVAPAEAAAEVVSLAQRLGGLAATYPIMNKLHAIEFGNEVYQDEDVATYAAQYDAAHRALAANGLSSWKLLAVATAVCGVYNAENWIPDFIGHMSARAAEVDGWTVHPYGSMITDATPTCTGPHGYGWPDVRDWHQIAVARGSQAPWYITEVGQCISAGSACDVVDPATQAADLTRYLDSAASEPWVVFFNWYTSCDDSSGGYGLLAENSAGVCGASGASAQRPAFHALAQWLAAHGEG